MEPNAQHQHESDATNRRARQRPAPQAPGIERGLSGKPGHDALLKSVRHARVRRLISGGGNQFSMQFRQVHKPSLCQTPTAAQGLHILLFGQSGQILFHFRAGAEGADFDQGDGPAGQLRDFLDRTLLNFQQSNDEPGGG